MKATTIIIAVLLAVCAVTTSAAWSSYTTTKLLKRDYEYLESRYVDLFARTMNVELTSGVQIGGTED